MGIAPTWLHQLSPLLHKTTLTTDEEKEKHCKRVTEMRVIRILGLCGNSLPDLGRV